MAVFNYVSYTKINRRIDNQELQYANYVSHTIKSNYRKDFSSLANVISSGTKASSVGPNVNLVFDLKFTTQDKDKKRKVIAKIKDLIDPLRYVKANHSYDNQTWMTSSPNEGKRWKISTSQEESGENIKVKINLEYAK